MHANVRTGKAKTTYTTVCSNSGRELIAGKFAEWALNEKFLKA